MRGDAPIPSSVGLYSRVLLSNSICLSVHKKLGLFVIYHLFDVWGMVFPEIRYQGSGFFWVPPCGPCPAKRERSLHVGL